jgi:hypothetical protein
MDYKRNNKVKKRKFMKCVEKMFRLASNIRIDLEGELRRFRSYFGSLTPVQLFRIADKK